MAVYPDNTVLNLLYLDQIRSNDKSFLVSCARRFRLQNPSDTGKKTKDAAVEFTRPLSESIELPVIAPALYNKPYQYAYGIHKKHPSERGTFADGIIKLDMSSSKSPSAVWMIPEHIPSEPIFVPRPDGTEEDDGVLLTVVLDERKMRSAMVVLDARSMTEVARAEMPEIFPIGYHGVWTGRSSEEKSHL